MSDLPEYQLDRLFNAPRDLVWKAWTDPELLARWYGPNIETVIHEFDLRPGGVWLNEMKWGENSNFQKVEFLQVEAQDRMVWNHCSADANWNVAASPMMPDWPRVLLTTVEFSDAGEQTNVRLHQVPVDATEAEIACFAQMKDGMSKGWSSGYEIIDTVLTELKA